MELFYKGEDQKCFPSLPALTSDELPLQIKVHFRPKCHILSFKLITNELIFNVDLPISWTWLHTEVLCNKQYLWNCLQTMSRPFLCVSQAWLHLLTVIQGRCYCNPSSSVRKWKVRGKENQRASETGLWPPQEGVFKPACCLLSSGNDCGEPETAAPAPFIPVPVVIGPQNLKMAQKIRAQEFSTCIHSFS